MLERLSHFFEALGHWVNGGIRTNLRPWAEDIAKDVRSNTLMGHGANGFPFPALSEATLQGPIRRDHKNTKRSAYGNTPMSATGKTAQSIRAKRVDDSTWEISSSTEEGNSIIRSNAKPRHTGVPWGGDTPKPTRDVLEVTDRQVNKIEDSIVKSLDAMVARMF